LAVNVQERGIPVIEISDSIFSPLGLFPDVYLEVDEIEVFGFRGVALSALMCPSLFLVVELDNQMNNKKRRSNES